MVGAFAFAFRILHGWVCEGEKKAMEGRRLHARHLASGGEAIRLVVDAIGDTAKPCGIVQHSSHAC
jgi:hypothetical protein